MFKNIYLVMSSTFDRFNVSLLNIYKSLTDPKLYTFYIFCKLFERGLFCPSTSGQRFRVLGSDTLTTGGREWFQHPTFTYRTLGSGAHQLSQFKHWADVQPVLKANTYHFKKTRGSLRTWMIFSSKQFPWWWHLIELQSPNFCSQAPMPWSPTG